MKKIRIVFIGTAAIGCPLLKALKNDDRFEVSLVVTQEDKPAGRKMLLTPPPVKEMAVSIDLPVFQPKKINDPESLKVLKNAQPDFLIVIAFGQILSEDVLAIPLKDCLNIHASLLPNYRGSSPIQACLLNGDKKTGFCLMKMTKEMDAGPVFKAFEVPIDASDNQITLTEKMSHLIGQQIPDAIFDVANGKLSPLPQVERKATYVKKIVKSDGKIDWNETVEQIDAKVRAFAGWPSSFTDFRGKRLKIVSIIPHQNHTLKEAVGKVIKVNQIIGIKVKNGFIELVQVQPEGRNVQSITDFLHGNPDFLGSNLIKTP